MSAQSKDSLHLTVVAVGCPLPFALPGLGAGFNMNAGSGPLAVVALENPTQLQVRGMRSGKIRLGLVEAGKHVLFIMLYQPELSDEWADMPFGWGMVRPEKRKAMLEDLAGKGSDSRYLFNFIVCDQDRIVRALRAVSVSPRFTQALDAALLRQEANLGEFTREAHDAEIAAAYRNWPTGEEMMSASSIVETAGSDDLD